MDAFQGRLKAVNYFRKNIPSKMFDMVKATISPYLCDLLFPVAE